MSITYERIKGLAAKRGMSLRDVARKSGFKSETAIYRYNQGVTPRDTSLESIAQTLGTTIDYLKGKNDNPTDSKKSNYYELNKKEKADIAVQAEKLIEGLESGAEVNFYGEPATDEQKNRLRIAIQMAMEMNKQEAKKKFTPKKYRD